MLSASTPLCLLLLITLENPLVLAAAVPSVPNSSLLSIRAPFGPLTIHLVSSAKPNAAAHPSIHHHQTNMAGVSTRDTHANDESSILVARQSERCDFQYCLDAYKKCTRTCRSLENSDW